MIDRKTKNGWGSKQAKLLFAVMIFFIVIMVWKFRETDTTDFLGDDNQIENLQKIIHRYKEYLQLTPEQLDLLDRLDEDLDRRKIYAVTPTYARLVQKAELTRISQTLSLVPNVHWIVIEDADSKSKLVTNLLKNSGLGYTHLFAKTPPFEKLQKKMPRYKKHRGVEQRNAALKWLRSNLNTVDHKGYVYFMDDDNTYSVNVFKEIMKVKKVGVWPVGLVGGLNAEVPIVDDKTGRVKGWISGWKPNRPFAIDMAGFAVNLELILTKPTAVFAYTMEKGFQESEFLSYLTTRDEVEPLADNCTKVYVWHTRTQNPSTTGVVPGLEV